MKRIPYPYRNLNSHPVLRYHRIILGTTCVMYKIQSRYILRLHNIYVKHLAKDFISIGGQYYCK